MLTSWVVGLLLLSSLILLVGWSRDALLARETPPEPRTALRNR
jgi:hypothetical protein